MNNTMRREQGLNEIQAYMQRREQEAEQRVKEEMIITAFKNNATPALIEALRLSAGITDDRLAEIKAQTKPIPTCP